MPVDLKNPVLVTRRSYTVNHPRTQKIVAPECTQNTSVRHKGPSFLRLRRVHLGLGAMTFAGLMTCLPVLPASAEIVHETVERESFQTVTVTATAPVAEIERGEYGVQYFSVVQSPVAPGTSVSSGFGYRVPPCDVCSSYHEGVDLLPGAGTPVLAISDGVVTDADNASGSLGVFLTIKHVIDGQEVYSTYAHLAYGSMPYSIGSTVARGETVGAVGNTGASTGPHLHFEIRFADGSATNPLPWLAQHVNV